MPFPNINQATSSSPWATPSPVTHYINNKMQRAHQDPFKQPDTSSLSAPHHSAPAKRASSLLLQHDRHHPAPGPLHRMWPLPGPLFWIPWLTPCHSDFTQKPLPWGAITVHPPAISTCYLSSPVDLEPQAGTASLIFSTSQGGKYWLTSQLNETNL